MNRLTRQEQLVLCSVLSLLLVGLVVKVYRQSHPGSPPAAVANVNATNVVELK